MALKTYGEIQDLLNSLEERGISGRELDRYNQLLVTASSRDDQAAYDDVLKGIDVQSPDSEPLYTGPVNPDPLAPENLGESGLINDSADETFAEIVREQFADYEKRYIPVEDELMRTMGDKAHYEELMGQVDTEASNRIAASAGIADRNLSRYGVQLTDREQQQINRQTDLRSAAASAGAQNMTRRELNDMGFDYGRTDSLGTEAGTERVLRDFTSGLSGFSRDVKGIGVDSPAPDLTLRTGESQYRTPGQAAKQAVRGGIKPPTVRPMQPLSEIQ